MFILRVHRSLLSSVFILGVAHAGVTTDKTWPRVTLPKVANLPVIDGAIGEQAWKASAGLSGFTLQHSRAFPKCQPEVYMAWHEAGLLIALDAPLPPGKRARASHTVWNGVEWQDDLFAVHLDLEHGHTKSLWFAVNALGTKSDSKSGETPDTSDWQAAATNTPGRWCAEMLIPWRAMGITAPVAGQMAGFNIAVNAGWLGGVLTWAPTARGLISPSHLGHFVFGGNESMRLSRVDFSHLGECRTHVEATEKAELTCTLSQLSAGGATNEVTSENHGLEPRKPKLLRVAIPLEQGFPKAGDYLLRYIVSGASSPLLVQSWALKVGQPVDLVARAFITKNILRVEVRSDTTIFPVAETDFLVSVDSREGQILEQKIVPDPKTGAIQLEIPGARIPKGRLTIKARATRAGSGTFTTEKILESPLQPPWLGTQEGITHKVPAPWTPIQIKKDTVTCWGRTYRFAGSLLPTEVETLGAQVLAGPIVLKGSVAGVPFVWQDGKVAFIERSETRAVLEGSAHAAGLTLSGATAVEYDGMMRIDLRLTPAAAAVLLQDLTLEIPLKAEHARYLYHFPGMWGSIANSTTLPATGWVNGFKPFVWLGDADRGFAWFCESDRNWFPLGKDSAMGSMFDRSLVSTNINTATSGPDAALTILREGAKVVLRCRLIQGEQKITGPLEYTFGFHATPVKNPEKTVWDYRITHHGKYGLESEPAAVINTRVTYAADGRINPQQGTIECWYCPAFENRERGLPIAQRKSTVNRNIFAVKWGGDMARGSNCGFYWNEQVQGVVVWSRKEGKVTLNPSAPMDVKAGQWYHLALTWGERVRLYVDGKVVADVPDTGFIPGPLEKAVIELGGNTPMATLDELRILRVARPPAVNPGEYVSDADTLLLDHFENYNNPNVKPLGEVEAGLAFVPAKFGLGPTWDGAQLGTQLQRLANLGVRTVCFHEHWSPSQSYPYVTDENRPKLHSLIDGVHKVGGSLLLYMSRQFADNAPEWELYSEDVLPTPRGGAHTRQPPQKAYVVCWNTPWKDFCLYHLGKMMDEFGHDGWYLDGPEWPMPCCNPDHGCGYTAPDGTRRTSYDIFATREFMQRLYVLTRQRKPEGQINIHNSTVMVTPTLSWATSTWGGEQLDTHKAGAKTLDVLPMDAFQTELMGRQWGIPSEFLVYEGRPYYSRDMIAYTLLHGVLIRPGEQLLPLVSELWRMYDRFPFKDAVMYPYWNNADRITCAPAGVYATAYERPGQGLLLFVSNLGETNVDAVVALNLVKLNWKTVTAWDALTENPIDATDGVLRLPLSAWRFAAVRVKPK